MKKFILLGLMALCAGCATTESQVANTLTNSLVPDAPVVANQTPIQGISAALGVLANNKLLSAVNNDSDLTLAWVASPEGPTDPLAKFQAASCPTAVKLATGSIQQNIAALQARLAELDANAQGLGTEGPHIILTLTKLRYGQAGAPGSDPSTMVAELKKTIFSQISAVVDSCRQIFPAKQVNELMKQAAAAGLTGGAANVVGVLP